MESPGVDKSEARTTIKGSVAKFAGHLSLDDVKLAVEKVRQSFVQDRSEEATNAPRVVIIAAKAREMLIAMKGYSGTQQLKRAAEKVIITSTSLDETPASVDTDPTFQALKQAKIAAATEQNSGVKPNYVLNSGYCTTLLSYEGDIVPGNVKGAVYSGGFVVSVAGLSAELNENLAEEILATSLDEVRSRMSPVKLVEALPQEHRADVA